MLFGAQRAIPKTSKLAVIFKPKPGQQLSSWDGHWYLRRLCLCVVTWNDLMWLTMVRMGVEAVACGRVQGEMVMLKSNDQLCFQDGHTEAFIVGIILLLWCLVVTPTLVLKFVIKAKKQKRHRTQPVLQSMATQYAPFKDKIMIRMVLLGWFVRAMIASMSVVKAFDADGALAGVLTGKTLQLLFIKLMKPLTNPSMLKIVGYQTTWGVLGGIIGKTRNDLSIRLLQAFAVVLLLVMITILRVRGRQMVHLFVRDWAPAWNAAKMIPRFAPFFRLVGVVKRDTWDRAMRLYEKPYWFYRDIQDRFEDWQAY